MAILQYHAHYQSSSMDGQYVDKHGCLTKNREDAYPLPINVANCCCTNWLSYTNKEQYTMIKIEVPLEEPKPSKQSKLKPQSKQSHIGNHSLGYYIYIDRTNGGYLWHNGKLMGCATTENGNKIYKQGWWKTEEGAEKFLAKWLDKND